MASSSTSEHAGGKVHASTPGRWSGGFTLWIGRLSTRITRRFFSIHWSAWKVDSEKFVSLAENSSASWQPPVELGERCGAHAVDYHRGADDEATDYPRFLDTCLPKGEGRIVECRSPYWAEPSEEEHVLRSPSKRSEQRPQGQHRGQPPEQKHRHDQKHSSPTKPQPPLPR